MTSSSTSLSEAAAATPPSEQRVAVWLAVLVLLVLTVVKGLGAIPVIGTIGFTAAALIQLYLPLWRCDRLGRDAAFVGLHLDAWRTDAKWVAVLCALTFPPYVLGYHLYVTAGHDWLSGAGLPELARWVPRRAFTPELPTSLAAWLVGAGWFAKMAATHVLGVALPEEVFYRGYLQPRLEERWAPRRRWFGVALGRGALLACLLFALGHFLGEWNPMRLGPFFPALLFAWLRNASGSVVGAVAYHAACNILGEVLFTLYGG